MVANGWPVGPHSLIIVLLTPRSLRGAKISWGGLMPQTLLRPMRIWNRVPDARLVIAPMCAAIWNPIPDAPFLSAGSTALAGPRAKGEQGSACAAGGVGHLEPGSR